MASVIRIFEVKCRKLTPPKCIINTSIKTKHSLSKLRNAIRHYIFSFLSFFLKNTYTHPNAHVTNRSITLSEAGHPAVAREGLCPGSHVSSAPPPQETAKKGRISITGVCGPLLSPLRFFFFTTSTHLSFLYLLSQIVSFLLSFLFFSFLLLIYFIYPSLGLEC